MVTVCTSKRMRMSVRGRARTERVKGGKKEERTYGYARDGKGWRRRGRVKGDLCEGVFCDRARSPAVAGIIGNVISYIRYA